MKPSSSGRWEGLSLWFGPLVAAIIAIAIPNCAERPTPLARIAGPDGSRFGVTLDQRRMFFRDIAQNDERWRGIAEKTFPGDVWAQADHWSDHMSQYVRTMADKYEVSIVSILLAYDEGLHEAWRGPGQKLMRTSWPPLTRHKR